LTVQSAAFNDEEESTDTEPDGDSPTPSLLAAAVEETRAEAAIKNASTTIPAYDKLMARVEMNTTRVYELRDSLIGVASEEQIADVTRRIDDIERSVAEAIAIRETDEETARTQLLEALQRTQKLVVFMTDIEVSQTVDIEELVPVVLTPEEKKTVLTELETKIGEKVEQIELVLPNVKDGDVVEKAITILAEIESIMADFSSTTEAFQASKTAAEEASALADNLFVVLEIKETKVKVPPVEIATSTNQMATSSQDTATTTEAITNDEATVRASTTATTTEPVAIESNDTAELPTTEENQANSTGEFPTSAVDTTG
jgi:hypothetical protein